ncbi:DUF1049 domain-containing protein [Curvibacter sp. CHRR-16]|uniref:lipopolysaccharide assembly protein LapA domain-containing protein n=1 Tax=Curvibacter sp. CHRR-16 TaxID=2835872 RepID=UPI001BDAE761|nr:lipopolysaccharide assembly protein LapA domain-containing protein [Curvibacter sp. CHRR-16]MBT0570773.1 DUF1049 domain-containing protein [Curvibacter sp. CHRR-16]
MTPIYRLLKWLLGAAIFFVLFVFALNNRSAVSVQLFAGHGLELPLIVVILLAFALGLLLGALTALPARTNAGKPLGNTSPPSAHSSVLNDPTQDGI